ncbi:WYL domain-containing protein [Salibacterium aidingense]|uniref:WYL domain-containing protein n=1 Tax=Salibacterium aidingense TaxID=384933 RepID=UPI000688D3A9|nr:hypothetical protein [Salibacterium aidingense]
MDGILKRAAENRDPVQVIYESRDGTLSQRTVTVHQMNERNVLVWCHYKQGIRTLRLENLLSARQENNSVYNKIG